jgi:hypothetical protein
MISLPQSLRAWKTERFAQTLKAEIEALGADTLPLRDASTHSGVVDDASRSISVLSSVDDDVTIQARVGVFFNEILAGCNCSEDPMPIASWCEVQVAIDKATAAASFRLVRG